MTRGRRLPVFVAVAVVAFTVISSAGAGSAPSLAFTPSSTVLSPYDYGTIDSGSTASQTFTLTNTGGTATAALKVSLTGAAFSKTADTCTATSLGPKKSCSITVQYAPTTDGATDTGTLTAMSKKPLAVATAYLSGKSTDPSADISLSYNPVRVGGFPPTLSIINGGPAAATVSVFVRDVSAIGNDPATEQVTGDAKTGFTVTTINPIASGGSVSFYIAEDVSTSAYAEVTASSAPDPDSTPNNHLTTEDDYVAIPGTETQSFYDCNVHGGTFATGTGTLRWSCSQWLASDPTDHSATESLLISDCTAGGGNTVVDFLDPSDQTGSPASFTLTCSNS